MIDHMTIPVNNLDLSRAFYEKAFIPLGYKIAFGKEGNFIAFAIGEGCLFEIAQHQEKTPLTPVHIAFRAKDKEAISAFYQAAIEAGGKDNGVPGPRHQYTKNYYACFILDPDGHNIEAMCDKD